MRIDLLNKAEGLTITKVTFRNRAVKAGFSRPTPCLRNPERSRTRSTRI